jgi:hypothetical protein
MRSIAYRVEHRRHDEDEPPVPVEAFDEVEDGIRFEAVEGTRCLSHIEAARNLDRFVAEATERRRDRLELDENVELVGLGLLADSVKENRNAHDRLRGRGEPPEPSAALARTGGCDR